MRFFFRSVTNTNLAKGGHLMRLMQNTLTLVAVMIALSAVGLTAHAAQSPVQLGPRPFYLVDQMEDGELKDTLEACVADIREYAPHDFSIGHRGAALQFPEHTKESYEAGRRMGAGILECDVTFTKDGELVCRHAQCDLHTTTNILLTDLARTCRGPFTPAEFDADGRRLKAATALCCTTDLTLQEFKRLKGKMDASDPNATTVEAFVNGTPSFRTDLYATGGTLLSHKESIALIDRLGAKFTPELKSIDRDSAGNPLVAENNGFGESGLNQQSYARQMIQEYIDAGIDASQVFAQSFNLNDVLQWIHEFPTFGLQAVYLISENPGDPLAGPPSAINENAPTLEEFVEVQNLGVHIIAPPMPVLVSASTHGKRITPSAYAQRARQAGFNLISWTAERSGRIVEDVLEGGGTFYYQTTLETLNNDGDILRTIDVLAQDVGIIGLFSDWPATTTFYANCLK
jgi:glycerophosphoryl diester phosphodiesterase